MGNQAGKPRAGKYVHWDTAVTPAPPGKPHLVPGTPHSQPDVVTIRWEPPVNDGGAPVTGYMVEHRRTGSPHWVRSTPVLVPVPELALAGLEPGWRYQFRVSAQNAVGLSEPGDVSEPLTVTLNRSTTTAPYFLQELRDVVALENDTAEFRVVFRGNPAPKMSWYKDGFEIFSSRRMRVVTEGDQSSLIIYQAGFSDEGDIKCTATNRVGHAVTKGRLRLEAPPRVRLPRQYEDGLLFEMGEVIRLKVSVAGRPLPRVTWLHNGEPVTFGGRYEVMNTERATALRVSEARRADRGEYQVRATSRLGEDQASFLVTITDRPTPPGRAKVISAEGRIVKLEWTEPDDDGGCKIGNYIVEYYRIGWNVWLKAATCRQLSTTLEELIEGSEYKFRIKAENPYGVSDPSDESNVVFIPDPRRGLLEPPARKKGGKAGSRSSTLPPDLAKRKAPAHRASSPPAKKTLGRGWDADRPLPVISFDRVEVLDGSEKKRKDEDDDDLPPPVPPKTLRRANRLDGQPLPPQRQKSATLAPGTRLHQQQQDLVRAQQAVPKTKTTTLTARTRSAPPAQADAQTEIGPSPPPPPPQSAQQQPQSRMQLLTRTQTQMQSPLIPREEDDSLLHGSSELMLVLLPQSSVEGDDETTDAERAKEEEEEEEEKRRERAAAFAQEGLADGVAPPLSLSAPELGCGDILQPSLRNAVSSTELLHERAMARFYQAVAAEEAQKALERRRSIEDALPPAAHTQPAARPRGSSLTDEEEIRRVLRPRVLLPTTQPQPQPQPQAPPPAPPQLTPAQTRPRPPSPAAPRPPPPRSPPPPRAAPRPAPQKLPSEEEEEEDFARLRERLREAPGGRLPRRGPLPRDESEESHDSDLDAYLTGQSGEASMDASIDLGDEEEPELELEPELEPESEPELPRPLPIRSRYSEDDEELQDAEEADTYHPRGMASRALAMGSTAVSATATATAAAPLAEPECSPPPLRPPPSALARSVLAEEEPPEEPPPVPPHARSPLPAPVPVAPKPILKKHRSPSPELPSPPPRSPLPSSPRALSPMSRSSRGISPTSLSPMSASPPSHSPLPISPRALSPISRPMSPPPTRDLDMEMRRRRSPAPAPEIVPETASSIRRPSQVRKSSLEEEEGLARAISDHYGDIIRMHARAPKPKKLFVNTAELKAAAEHQPRPLLPPKPPQPAAKVPSPPKRKEPTPPPEPPPPRTLMERLGAWWWWATGYAEETVQDDPQSKKKPVRKLEESEEESEAEEEEEEEEKQPSPKSPTPAPVPNKAPPAPSPTPPRTPTPGPTPTPPRTPTPGPVLSRSYSPPPPHRFVRSKTPPPSLVRDHFPAPAAHVAAEAPVSTSAATVERLPPVIPLSPEEEEAIRKVTEKKVRSTIEYLTDLAMFSVACWLYVFKDELYAVPVLLLMVYRQLREAIQSRLPRFLRRST